MVETVPRLHEGLFKSLCSTQLKKCKYKLKLTIPSFSFYEDTLGHDIVSSTFSNGTEDGLKWRLEVDPFKDYLALKLHLVSSNVSSLNTKCKFSILNAELEEVEEENYTHQFKSNQSLSVNMSIYKQNLFEFHNEYLPDDVLTILCEVIAAVSNENISRDLTISACHVTNNLGLVLLKNLEFSDITLQADGKQIQAHKAVLALRSNVFRAMFQHDMKESRTNLVDIQDVDYEILKQMLYFIYTDQFFDIVKVTDLMQLSVVADKYELDGLKHGCEKMLSINLTNQNAVEYYTTADQFNAENLTLLIKSYIITNFPDITKTSGFALLVRTHPDLVIEALL